MTDSLIIWEITVANRANDSAKTSKLWEKGVKEVAMGTCWQEIGKYLEDNCAYTSMPSFDFTLQSDN